MRTDDGAARFRGEVSRIEQQYDERIERKRGEERRSMEAERKREKK